MKDYRYGKTVYVVMVLDHRTNTYMNYGVFKTKKAAWDTLNINNPEAAEKYGSKGKFYKAFNPDEPLLTTYDKKKSWISLDTYFLWETKIRNVAMTYARFDNEDEQVYAW